MMINIHNTERKGHDVDITGEALNMIDSDEELIGRNQPWFLKNTGHKGVIGIVASRLTRNITGQPWLTRSNGYVAGLGPLGIRYDLYDAWWRV